MLTGVGGVNGEPITDGGQIPVQIAHQSVADYILDRAHQGSETERRYAVSIADHQVHLVLACLKTLNRRLPPLCQYLDLVSHEGTALPSPVPVIPDHLVPKSLLYASKFWQYHLQNVPTSSAALETSLRAFFQTNWTQWLVFGAPRRHVDFRYRRWMIQVCRNGMKSRK